MNRLRIPSLLAAALLAVSSLTAQSVYLFPLAGNQEVPMNGSAAKGVGMLTLNAAQTSIHTLVYHNVMNATAAHIHQQAPGVNGGIIFGLGVTANPISVNSSVSPAQVTTLTSGLFYVNVHSMLLPGGEIRGQILNPSAPQVFISEICANPGGVLDTNMDGTMSANEDEFIEIVNGTNTTANISCWSLLVDGVEVHTFSNGTLLPAAGSLVVFGGGSVAAFNAAGAAGLTSNNTALNLVDGGGTVTLRRPNFAIEDTVTYGAVGAGTSATASPAAASGMFVAHNTLGGSPAHSAGRMNDNLTRWPAATLPTMVAAYRGNCTDAAIRTTVNGVLKTNVDNVHGLNPGDSLSLNFMSPGGSLTGSPFLALAQVFGASSIPNAILLPGDAAPFLVADVMAPATILADGLAAPGTFFAPVLGTYTVSSLIPPSIGGFNLSAIINCLSFDPGRNLVNLGIAEAHRLDIP